MKTIDDFDINGKRVLVRVDLNSAIMEGAVQLSGRIVEHAKTLKELSDKRAKVVILAHQGRKGGEEYLESLEQHAKLLSKEIKDRVYQYLKKIIAEEK